MVLENIVRFIWQKLFVIVLLSLSLELNAQVADTNLYGNPIRFEVGFNFYQYTGQQFTFSEVESNPRYTFINGLYFQYHRKQLRFRLSADGNYAKDDILIPIDSTSLFDITRYNSLFQRIGLGMFYEFSHSKFRPYAGIELTYVRAINSVKLGVLLDDEIHKHLETFNTGRSYGISPNVGVSYRLPRQFKVGFEMTASFLLKDYKTIVFDHGEEQERKKHSEFGLIFNPCRIAYIAYMF